MTGILLILKHILDLHVYVLVAYLVHVHVYVTGDNGFRQKSQEQISS